MERAGRLYQWVRDSGASTAIKVGFFLLFGYLGLFMLWLVLDGALPR